MERESGYEARSCWGDCSSVDIAGHVGVTVTQLI